MALRIAISPSIRPSSSSSSASCNPSPSSLNRSLNWAPRLSPGGGPLGAAASGRVGRAAVAARSSLETAVPAVGQVNEVDKDTFWPLIKAAGDKVVVLDMYTQWCGPCKVIAPKFKELSEKHLDVVFMKLDCNQENKPLAKELGIRVVPTFKILKEGKVVKEVTGAKYDDLVSAIETAKSS
ncbi:thioredoxin F1, chloroplastic-like [Canna indica]|uniref:Thioredoxin F1, chloroplastic-like n=1 Tax=Canna indica TaxID=4628 RepID=A0AAQ3K879_9LILI|nr:thioredoxin F1, chloroplastic-like [Canna indica]